MKYFQKLVGKDVYLSPMNVEDAPTYTRWMNDFQVTDGIGASRRIMSIKAELDWLNSELSSSSEYQFAIVRKSDDKLLGNCSVHGVNAISQSAEVGLFIGDSENRERGYGTQVMELLLSYAFFYLNMHNVMLKVFSFNERAIHVYEKVGFKEIGRRRQNYYLNGKYYDDVFMDILKDEFPINHIENTNV